MIIFINFSNQPYEAIKHAAKFPTEYFILRYFTLDSQQFIDLVVAARKAKYECFQYCYIDTDQPIDFGNKLDDSTFIRLYFCYTGSDTYSKWQQDDFKRFRNIVEGLSEVECIRNRDINIYLQHCSMTKAQAQQILTQANLTKMVICGL